MTREIASSAQIADDVYVSGNGTLQIHPYATVERLVALDLGKSGQGRITVGPRAKLKQGTVIRAYSGFVEVGARVSVGEYSVLSGHGGLRIGATTIIAGHCYFAPSQHIMESQTPIRFQGETFEGILLEDGVWVGAHVTVQDNVTIGAGAVIGSGSVVTRSMPAQAVCFGVPCKPVRHRTTIRQDGT